MTAIWFSLSVHFIVMAQTGLECFGMFIEYMSTVSNVRITFGCVQFVSHESHLYTCTNIYARTKYMLDIHISEVLCYTPIFIIYRT